MDHHRRDTRCAFCLEAAHTAHQIMVGESIHRRNMRYIDRLGESSDGSASWCTLHGEDICQAVQMRNDAQYGRYSHLMVYDG